jgi:uncharacterized integral membrane protein
MGSFIPEINSAGTLMFYLVFKIVKYFSFFLALYFATSYMSQIYVEKVYIDNQNPPHFIWSAVTTTILELIFLVILTVIGYILFTVNVLDKNVVTLFVIDSVVVILISFLLGWIITSVMYSAKVLNFKEEGLRAIRAYERMMRYVGIVINGIPFGIFIVGSMYVITKF